MPEESTRDEALAEQVEQGPHLIPADYPFAEEVPKGGSKCANCAFVRASGTECANRLYQQAMGTEKLLKPANRFCCLVWTPKE